MKIPLIGAILFSLSAGLLAAGPTKITTAPLSQLTVGVLRTAPAEVISLNESVLSAQVQATVESIRADVGAEVKKGETLIVLDARDLTLNHVAAKAAVAAAQAQLELTQARLSRAVELQQKKFLSADELKQTQSQLKAAQAELELRRTQAGQAALALERATIRAPFDGVILARAAQVGMLAAPGTPLITLVDRTAIEIAVSLQANQVFGFRQAAALNFRAQGDPLPVLTKRLSSVIARSTRTVQARLTFAAFGAPIGSEGRVEWYDQDLLLPARLLTRRENQLGVFYFDGKVARFQPLPGAQEGRPAAVNLAPTTAIILEGRQGLTDGQAVAF